MTLEEILKYANIDVEGLVETAEKRRMEETLTEKGIVIPRVTKKQGRDLYYCNIPGRYSEDGRRHQITGNTEEECIANYKRKIYEFLRKQEEKQLTFANIYKQWLDAKKSGIRNSTYSRYMRMYINYIRDSEFGAYTLDEIRLPECETFVNSLYELHLGAENLKQVKSTLSQAMEYAIAHEMEGARANFFRSVKINENLCSTERTHRTDAWTDAEIIKMGKSSLKMWSESKKYRYSAVYMIMIYTGCRIGEVLALNWDDIDFHKKTLRVTKTVNRYTDYDTKRKILEIGKPKTAGSNRVIMLTDEAIAWLREMQKRNLQTGCCQTGRVVETQGEQITKPDVVNNSMKKFCREIGVQYRSSHTCRRTYATMLLEQGIPTPEVSADLGHKNLSTTQNSYYKRRRDGEEQLQQKNAVFLSTAVHSRKNA